MRDPRCDGAGRCVPMETMCPLGCDGTTCRASCPPNTEPGGGSCQPCGDVGQSCCGTTCRVGLCQGDTCVACGSAGQPCCAGNRCGGTLVCNGGRCAAPMPPPVELQGGWRWCQKCEGLHFAGAGPGVCPAGGEHTTLGSGAYSLPHNSPSQPGQDNWRYCVKCKILHYGGNGPGVCPAGGGHVVTGSGNYTLPHDNPAAPGQSNWRWCQRCEGLHYGGNGPGVCPGGPGGHLMNPSGNYTLPHQ